MEQHQHNHHKTAHSTNLDIYRRKTLLHDNRYVVVIKYVCMFFVFQKLTSTLESSTVLPSLFCAGRPIRILVQGPAWLIRDSDIDSSGISPSEKRFIAYLLTLLYINEPAIVFRCRELTTNSRLPWPGYSGQLIVGSLSAQAASVAVSLSSALVLVSVVMISLMIINASTWIGYRCVR